MRHHDGTSTRPTTEPAGSNAPASHGTIPSGARAFRPGIRGYTRVDPRKIDDTAELCAGTGAARGPDPDTDPVDFALTETQRDVEESVRRGCARFDDLRVPVGDRIGEEGKVFRYLIDGLDAGASSIPRHSRPSGAPLPQPLPPRQEAHPPRTGLEGPPGAPVHPIGHPAAVPP